MTQSRDEAAAALAEVDAARSAVDAEADRTLAIVATATAVLTFLDFAAKDEIPDRRRRMVVTAIVQCGLAAIVTADAVGRQVMPYAVADGPDARGGLRIAALGLGWYAAERLAVHLLRRSRLRRPNTAAGALLAVTRPASAVLLARALPRAGRDA